MHKALLILLFFLSSCGCVAAKPSEYRYAEATGKSSERGGCRSGGIVGRFCLPFTIPSEKVFTTGTEPVYWSFQWPKVPTVADQLIIEARERLKPLVYEHRPRRHAWWAIWVVILGGIGLLIGQSCIIEFERRM